MALEIRTAAELIALDVEGRGAGRRAARETEVLQRVLQAFVDRPGPVRVDEIVSAFPGRAAESLLEALAKLNEDDLVRIDAGRVNLAYPFSASPTPFVVDLDPSRGRRYVCCACPRPVLQHAGFEPFLDQPHDTLVRNPMLDEPNQPSVIDGPEKLTDVTIEHPVHLRPHESDVERIQRIVRADSIRPPPATGVSLAWHVRYWHWHRAANAEVPASS